MIDISPRYFITLEPAASVNVLGFTPLAVSTTAVELGGGGGGPLSP